MLTKRNPSGISAVLLKKAVDGDEIAFKSIYDTYSGTMYTLCLRYGNDVSEANDIFQEGFVNLYLNLSKFRHEGSFEGWIRTIFVRTSLDYIANRKIDFYEIDNVGAEDNDFVNGFDKISMDELVNLIQQMDVKYRTVLNLYCIEGYTHKQISDLLGIAEGTSKSHLARAKTILKQKLLHKREQK